MKSKKRKPKNNPRNATRITMIAKATREIVATVIAVTITTAIITVTAETTTPAHMNRPRKCAIGGTLHMGLINEKNNQSGDGVLVMV